MNRYKSFGLGKLLEMDYQGRKSSCTIPIEAVEDLTIKLRSEEGFGSYQEIQIWLKEEHAIEVAYSTVHKLVRYSKATIK
ncbi:hypothetical protein CCP3SC1_1160002 [Gammaproteobacteria bacterium]